MLKARNRIMQTVEREAGSHGADRYEIPEVETHVELHCKQYFVWYMLSHNCVWSASRLDED